MEATRTGPFRTIGNGTERERKKSEPTKTETGEKATSLAKKKQKIGEQVPKKKNFRRRRLKGRRLH